MDAAAAASAVSGAGECGGTPGSSKEKERDTQMDAFLRSRGLCRKRIAKDGSCLFRAVAEQVFHSQSEHFGVRKACVSYLRRNRENFEAFIEGSFEEYLRHLENPQEWVGEVEISALSLMYKHDFVIYQEPDAPPSYVTENGFPDKVQLCFSNGNHYDLVYEKQFTNAAALCQSILYEMLYEKVLSVEVGDVIYELSTNDGKISEAAEEHLNSSGESDIEDDVSQGKVAKNRATNRIKFLTGNQIPKGETSPAAAVVFQLKLNLPVSSVDFYNPEQQPDARPKHNTGDGDYANLKHAKSELRCEQNTLVNKNVNGASEPIKTQTPGSTEQAPSKVLPAAVSFGANSTAPLSVDSHPSSVPSPPPSVPSVPTVVPSQPNEPILCRPAAGVPFQVTTSIAPAAAGPTVSMTQVISSPIAPLPVPVHPVNQPQMPLPQTLTPYQDLLYPGFPLNEKGECVSIPPYSYSKSGDDLPKDKGILQFFFNLGIKAYSCPMWAPHSYLYPLHQAYLNACRMYSSKVSSPVCHSGPWFQAPSSTPREASAVPVQMGGDLPHANEARLNGQYIDGGHGLASQSPEAAQSQGHQGSLDHSVSDPMQHSHMQPSHSGTGENSVLEERFLQPAFGHTPFIGGFQVAPAFTPPFWLGYPMQPFHEGMVAHNLRTYTEHEPKVADCPTVAPVDGDQCIASIPVDGTILQHQEGYSGEPSSSGSPTATGVDAQGEHNFVPSPSLKMKPEVESPVASRQQSQPSVGQVNETESAALSSAALDAGGSTTSIKKTGVPCVEGTDEPKDLQSTCKPESRVPVCKEELPKAESSEDEREVSEMLNRGRNKYYYSQNYVGRRGRNEKGHPFGRSGYPNSRAEEGRRGAQSKGMFYRDRDENRQSQHFRERGDARWKSREMYKAGKNVDRQWNFQK
nr:PREDICTED: OTU domain-containing protein 4 [Latimeria chalumnae]|eukprot:XP_014343649.1 PREDICTED: OTU domain-containing protein 4 [Latimeria chalumnae]